MKKYFLKQMTLEMTQDIKRNFVGREKREGQRKERMPQSINPKVPGAPGSIFKQMFMAEMLSVSGMVGDDGGPVMACWHMCCLL